MKFNRHYSYYLTIAAALVVIVGGTYLFPRVAVNSSVLLGDVSSILESDNVNVKDYGAKGDGTSNDINSLRKVFEQVKTRSDKGLQTTVYFPAGTYLVNGGIGLVPSNTTIRGDGASSIIKRASCPEAKQNQDIGCNKFYIFHIGDSYYQGLFVLNGAKNVTIDSMAFDHNYAGDYFPSIAFRAAGSSNVSITNNHFFDTDIKPNMSNDKWAIVFNSNTITTDVEVSNNSVDGDMQLTAGGAAGLKNVTVRDNTVRNGRSYSIALTSLVGNSVFENITITNNRIENANGYGILIGPDTSTATNGVMKNITITNNTITDFRRRAGNNPVYGIYVIAHQKETTGVNVSGNTIKESFSNGNYGIAFVSNRFPSNFTACPDQVTFNCPDQINWISNVTVQNNVIDNVAFGMSLTGIRDATVSGNTVTNSAREGFLVENTYNTTLSNNKVSGSAVGAYIYGNKGLTLTTNAFTDQKGEDATGILISLPGGTFDGGPSPRSMKIAQVTLSNNTVSDSRGDKGQKTQQYGVRTIFDTTWGTGAISRTADYVYDIWSDGDIISGNKTSDIKALTGTFNKGARPTGPVVPPPTDDAVAPIIALNGNADITITVGEGYTDAGATATDDVDGNITNKVTVNNQVVAGTIGTYTVTYSVKDAAGNSASASRTVRVNGISGGGGGTVVTTVVSPPIPEPTLVSIQGITDSLSESISNLAPALPTGTWSFLPAIKNIVSPVRPSTNIVPVLPVQTGNKKSYDIVQADYILNGTLIHTTTAFPDGWRLDTATLEDGQYTLSTKLFYADGTTDGSSSTFMVANSPTLLEKIITYIRGILGK